MASKGAELWGTREGAGGGVAGGARGGSRSLSVQLAPRDLCAPLAPQPRLLVPVGPRASLSPACVLSFFSEIKMTGLVSQGCWRVG